MAIEPVTIGRGGKNTPQEIPNVFYGHLDKEGAVDAFRAILQDPNNIIFDKNMHVSFDMYGNATVLLLYRSIDPAKLLSGRKPSPAEVAARDD